MCAMCSVSVIVNECEQCVWLRNGALSGEWHSRAKSTAVALLWTHRKHIVIACMTMVVLQTFVPHTPQEGTSRWQSNLIRNILESPCQTHLRRTHLIMNAPPDHFLCPISHQPMKDPVTIASGITFDRENILAWFRYVVFLHIG